MRDLDRSGDFLFVLVGLRFELMFAKEALYCLSHTSSHFAVVFFGDGVLRTVC
jgi:hypothetical protein